MCLLYLLRLRLHSLTRPCTHTHTHTHTHTPLCRLIFGLLYFMGFLFIAFMILLNILLAIIVDAYVEVKDGYVQRLTRTQYTPQPPYDVCSTTMHSLN